MTTDLSRNVQVSSGSIEKSLAELWRAEGGDQEAITRAALWNVVAHTCTSDHHAQASETLSQASAAVPQRTIVVRSAHEGEAELRSWISANCHLTGDRKQVCSEEINIVASGEHVERVPPLVQSLLLPDMPVAVWWIGDLPNQNEAYVEQMLDPADRIIVDSVHFDRPADLELVRRVGEQTATNPADLNWLRFEDWRMATASVFDPPHMRSRLREIRRIRVAAVTESSYFGELIEAVYFASWISAQLGHRVEADGRVDGLEYEFERRPGGIPGSLANVEIGFADGTTATIARDSQRGLLTATMDGVVTAPDSVTRTLGKRPEDLIVRLLKQPDSDRLLSKVLPVAIRMAKRVA
ncbi:MAG TPA: glucose-6-phosphate dehydrogenase assembly protein OpcA [Thermoanaerobaculia bacterium]|jgi:glucose-6-phosphate dehydrogenase assembly protein OpcA|nr:glucose-6-phosphate dehydrogenase assembly protein OpcA [Thermoanaerobaculia bacterium]